MEKTGCFGRKKIEIDWNDWVKTALKSWKGKSRGCGSELAGILQKVSSGRLV